MKSRKGVEKEEGKNRNPTPQPSDHVFSSLLRSSHLRQLSSRNLGGLPHLDHLSSWRLSNLSTESLDHPPPLPMLLILDRSSPISSLSSTWTVSPPTSLWSFTNSLDRPPPQSCLLSNRRSSISSLS